MKRLIFGVLLFVLLMGLSGQVVQPLNTPHANCCLCMCHAQDETLCSRMCIRLQHGKKIIEEPEMIVCTRECERVHVKKLDWSNPRNPVSRETKEKISNTLTGRKQAKEVIERSVAAMESIRKSPEYREKMRLAANKRWHGGESCAL